MEDKVLDLSAGVVDITDPCYDRGTWCAIWELPVKAGEWIVHAELIDAGEWGNRVASIEARLNGHNGSPGELIGEIGVDAGMAGFFAHKPDYTDDGAWEALLNKTCFDNGTYIPDRYFYEADTGVFSDSGYGDGGYDVLAHRDDDGEIDVLRIEFIEEGC